MVYGGMNRIIIIVYPHNIIIKYHNKLFIIICYQHSMIKYNVV